MFFKSFEVQNNVSNHKKTAIDLLILRDKFRLLLIEIQMNKADTKEIFQKYDDLQRELGEVYRDAPNTTDKAVERANKALKINKDNEFSDKEIDENLPNSLKRRSFE
jgi:hypothetical protein